MLPEASIATISRKDAQALMMLLKKVIDTGDSYGISIKNATDEFLKTKQSGDLSADTIEGYELTLKHLGKVIDLEADVSCITQDTVEKFKDYLQLERRLKKTGINRRLRELRAISNFCKERGYLSCALIIKEYRVDQTPSYLAEGKLTEILDKIMKPELREYIGLYLSTGARLNEIYNANLESDNFLTISAELSKTRTAIEIELTHENVIIYKKLMKSGLSSSRLSRLFKIACKAAGHPEFHFHNLRHTAAIMELIRSKDIYHVSRMLHHSSVKTTEQSYLVHSKRRLKADFPSLYNAE